MDRRTKLLLLLCSEKNPFWNEGRNVPVERGKLLPALGLNFQTVANWERGASVSDKKVIGVLERCRQLLGLDVQAEAAPTAKTRRPTQKAPDDSSDSDERDERSVAALPKDTIRPLGHRERRILEAKIQEIRGMLLPPRGEELPSVYRFGAVLGMDRDEVQGILDTSIYRAHPLFQHLFMRERATPIAQNVVDRFRGLYRTYLERDGNWLRSALRVRYQLEIGSYWTLRCKLNVPTIWGGGQNFEYDGFLSPRVDRFRLNWVFEERGEQLADLLYLITDQPRAPLPGSRDPRGPIAGRYLSCGQDPLKSIVQGRVLLLPEPIVDETTGQATDITRFMEEKPLFLGQGEEYRKERERVERILDGVETSAPSLYEPVTNSADAALSSS